MSTLLLRVCPAIILILCLCGLVACAVVISRGDRAPWVWMCAASFLINAVTMVIALKT